MFGVKIRVIRVKESIYVGFELRGLPPGARYPLRGGRVGVGVRGVGV